MRGLLLLLGFVSACAGGQRALEADRAYEAGVATVERLDVNVRRGPPAAVDVSVFGQLPDACTLIHHTRQERRASGIDVTLTTRRESGASCASEPQPFQRTLALDIHGLPAGLYFVSVNGVTTTFQLFVDPIDRDRLERFRTW